MKHSYMLVTHEGTVQRVDSDGPITPSAIREQVGGDFKASGWAVLMFDLTVCLNERGAQLGLAVNVKFKNILGNVLIGCKHQDVFRGLTDDEWAKVEQHIHHAL